MSAMRSAVRFGRKAEVETVPVRVTLSSRAEGARESAVVYAGQARVKLTPIIDNARARLGPTYDNVRVRATPLVDTARERTSPLYDAARESARERVYPAVEGARARLSEEVAPRLNATLAAAAAKRRPPPRKRRAWGKAVVVAGLGALLAAGAAWWRSSRAGSQQWVTDEADPLIAGDPSVGAPVPLSEEESAEVTVVSADAGGAGPDEALADEFRSGPDADVDEAVEPAQASTADIEEVIAVAEEERDRS